ncbi:hypothetical protein DYD21_08535 [Rhodohalobacter sp. SW132]|uniref:hypothetical protein n=1 Tax=Rhodohalobacter sp. SW132 TaxID=2293433 RepID=UPI000E284E47|nr:hypothetical protein [Rhodohalobacter sp. SW132]REL37817.1 hypothetical protein DYD21_08535 [Rhodohalobacter sp. SW132]
MQLILSFLFAMIAFTSSESDLPQSDHRIVLSIPSEGFTFSEQNFRIARELDIAIFEISNPEQIRQFPNESFYFFADAGPKYQVPGVLSQQIGAQAEEVIRIYRDFDREAPGRITALNILSHPFESYSNFSRSASLLTDSIRTEIDVPLYIRSAGIQTGDSPDGLRFTSLRVVPGMDNTPIASVIHFLPSGDAHSTYRHLNRVMNNLHELNESILILPAPWFFSEIESRGELRFLYRDYVNGEQVTLPLPGEPQSRPYINWSVILLFLIWGSFALHYRFQPIYGQSVLRYFSNHSFFVADVMEHRLRNVLPGLFLLIQHALLTGLFVFACVEVVVSQLGLDILSYHFSGVMWFGDPLFSLFMVGIIGAVVLQMISVLWIYVANRQLTAFSQILNLYSWPLHLNLFVVTFLIVFNQVRVAPGLILILGALFILIWFFSFNIAAIDSSKFLDTGLQKSVFLLLTVGVHILLILGILIYALNSPSLIEPILFALEAP